MESRSPVEAEHGGRTFLGQPRQLATLFSVEMWERFSFYGMQGILLIYLYYSVAEGGLGIDETTATSIVGAYGGTVYLSTILGAWLADRVIGAERTLFYAAIFVMAGHIALSALPGVVGVGVGLILIALGSGGVKANATSLVGTLYSPEDPRRDAGFSIYYLGINLGALLGPLLTGLLQTEFGFHWGFALAAVGMAIGLIVYSRGRKNLPPASNDVPNPLPAAPRLVFIGAGIGGLVLIVVLVLLNVITANRLATIVVWVTIAATITYFAVILSSSKITTVERRRVLSFIPVFIILLSGAFAALWTKWGDRQPSTPVKFAAGTVVMGVAFLLFLPMASTVPNSAPLLGLVGVIFVFTIAELLISPVSLSLATKLAPQAFHTQMVALLFLSIALGTAMAGVLAEYYSDENQVPCFGILGGIAIATGLVLLAITPPIKKLMGGVR